MLGGVQYAVALAILTGSIGIASPLQLANTFSNKAQFSGAKNAIHGGTEAFCFKDLQSQEFFREAVRNFGICTIAVLRKVPFRGTTDELGRYYCWIAKPFRPCIEDFLHSLETCIQPQTVEKVMEIYEEKRKILCFDGGRRVSGAAAELKNESEECLNEMLPEIRKCQGEGDLHNPLSLIIKQIGDCRTLGCLKTSLNVCGGPKPNLNAIMDDAMEMMSDRFDCDFNAPATRRRRHTPPHSRALRLALRTIQDHIQTKF